MENRRKTIFKTEKFAALLNPIILLALDYVVIVCAELSAHLSRNYLLGNQRFHISTFNFWFTLPVLFLIFLNLEQLYSRRMPFYKEAERLFRASCYAMLAFVLVLFMAKVPTSRPFVVLYAAFGFVFLSASRYILKSFCARHGLLLFPAIIIGAGKTAELLVRAIRSDVGLGYRIIGLLEDNQARPGILDEFPVLGGFADAERVIRETGVRSVFIAAPGLDEIKMKQLIYRVQPLVKSVGVLPGFVGVPMGGIEVEQIFQEKLLLLRLKNNLVRPLNKFRKAAFDYVLTIMGSLLSLPLLVIVAAIVKLDSPGPAIYSGLRLGRNGKLFKCYKFRSMHVNGDEILEEYLAKHPEKRAHWEKYHKLEDDPRVTRVGAFMRRTSIDELPQLFNVLKGDMSLVGARPYLPQEKDGMGAYAETILAAKPGITGYWQISGRSGVSFAERLEMESWYVRNWSVWLDIVLLFKTVAVVLLGKGAY